jgi:exosortase/archaeosortase family protein
MPFVVRLVVGWVMGLMVLSLFPSVEKLYVDATVESLRLALLPLPLDVETELTLVEVEGVLIEVVPECTPLLPTLLLVAAIAAFPASPPWKAIGILGGATSLWLFNLFRLMAMMMLLAYSKSMASFAHTFLLQSMTLLLICALFMLWVQMQRRTRDSS